MGIKGAQDFYGLDPDLSTLAKLWQWVFTFCCSRKKIMEMGSITKIGKERTFYYQQLMVLKCRLGAFIETIKYLKKNNTIKKLDLWRKLKNLFNKLSLKFNINKYIYMDGIACSPFLSVKTNEKVSNEFRTLFYEMLKNSVFMPWVAICGSHNENTLKLTEKPSQKHFKFIKKL